MKILIINPNTSLEFLKTIDSSAKKYASPGTEITTVNVPDGPEAISNVYIQAIQAPKVVDIVEKNRDNYDAFIIAVGCDLGLEACRIVAKNVIGTGEAAIMTACTVAKRFSFLHIRQRTAPTKWEQLRMLGVDRSRCASVRPVDIGIDYDSVRDRHKILDVYYEVGQKCIHEDGADALVLLCVGIVDLKEALEERLKVPVISGVASAVKIAEQFPSWGK